MNPSTTTKVYETQIEALEATRACMYCRQTPGKSRYLSNGEYVNCIRCNGSGRIYVLSEEQELRIWCRNAVANMAWHNEIAETRFICAGCNQVPIKDLGYTPSNSEGAWLRAAAAIGYESQHFRCGTRLDDSFFVVASLASADSEVESEPEDTYLAALVAAVNKVVQTQTEE